MPKKIVLLSDGTGNSAGKLFKTNVWRVYQSLDHTDSSIRVIYDDGVGTASFAPLALLGGAVGLGLARNVRDLYTFLCRTYEEGDEIYAFGFSRGAFTIRTLVALITSQGLVKGDTDRELARNVHEAYARHRRAFKTNWRLWYEAARKLVSPVPETPVPEPLGTVPDIQFLGLWDTVAAYGLPIDELQRGFDRYFHPLTFPDRDLSKKVHCARHALSIDDERRTFHPVLWNESSEREGSNRIQQVWFSGVHADVGGGYPKDTLSYVPLAWIMREAKKAGLSFKPNALEDFEKLADVHGELHDSRSGLAAYYRYAPRRIETLYDDDYAKVRIPTRPKIHESVFARIQDGRTAYAPLGIPADYDIVRADGTVIHGPELESTEGVVHYEGHGQAALRAGSSERSWDYVWHRRVLYFVTLALTLFLVAFPLLFRPRASGECHGSMCFLSTHIIRPVGSILPGALSPWVEAWAARPLLALVVGIALYASMRTSSRVEAAIRESSERAWRRLAPRREVAKYVPSLVCRIRNAPRLVTIYLGFARSVLPSLFALGLFIGLAWTFLHGVYSLAIAAVPCADSPKLVDVGDAALPIEFEASERCHATAMRMERGVAYDVRVDANEDWKDALLVFRDPMNPFASRGGLKLGASKAAAMDSTEAAQSRLKQPRVHLVAKIAGQVQPLKSGKFVARRSGELFVIADDLVAAIRPAWLPFGSDDPRTATITVTRKAAPRVGPSVAQLPSAQTSASTSPLRRASSLK